MQATTLKRTLYKTPESKFRLSGLQLINEVSVDEWTQSLDLGKHGSQEDNYFPPPYFNKFDSTLSTITAVWSVNDGLKNLIFN